MDTLTDIGIRTTERGSLTISGPVEAGSSVWFDLNHDCFLTSIDPSLPFHSSLGVSPGLKKMKRQHFTNPLLISFHDRNEMK